jgi:hypothetical protein
MIDPDETNETYRAASAIAAFDATQVAFAAQTGKIVLQHNLPKADILSPVLRHLEFAS